MAEKKMTSKPKRKKNHSEKKRLRKKILKTIPFARFSFLRLVMHFLMRVFDDVGIFFVYSNSIKFQ